MAVSISAPYLVVEADDLAYRGEPSPTIELTGDQRLTLLRVQQGMVDAGAQLTARPFPVDAIGHLIDPVTAAAAK